MANTSKNIFIPTITAHLGNLQFSQKAGNFRYNVTLAKLPGGMVVEGESPERTAIRKAMEEANLEVSLVPVRKRNGEPSNIKPYFVLQKKNHTFQVYLAEWKSGNPKPGGDVKEVILASFEEITKMIMRDKILEKHAKVIWSFVKQQKK